jgi:hypothetical protein
MNTIVRLISCAFSATDEASDAALPVHMFTVIGLLLAICLVLESRGQPLVAFDIF